MQPKISVIVPVYNASKYLCRCIDSILVQTFTDFELILVDDGSPDNCGEICDEYAQKDNRVKVIHKINGGVTAARADGVKICEGLYVTFVDADDYLLEDSLSLLIKGMTDDIDIVIGSYLTNGIHKSLINKSKILFLEEYVPKTIVKSGIHQGPWGKLYRRILFDDKTFDIPRQIVYGEDTIMNIRLAFKARKNVKIIEDSVYFYFDNEEGCCNTFFYDFNYLELWYKYLKASVPIDMRKKYMSELISFRFLYYNCVHRHYILGRIWHKLNFHEELLNDIKNSNCKVKIINKLSLKCNNPLTCWLFLRLIQLYKQLKNLR